MASSRYLPRPSVLRIVVAALLVSAVSVGPNPAHADDTAGLTSQAGAPGVPSSGVAATASEGTWWRESVAVFATLWDDARAKLTDDVPDWLQHLSRRKPATVSPGIDTAYVVLQDDRADGIDLVTLRYRLAERGPLRAYAGAGLNHARSGIDDPAALSTLLTRDERRSDVGATAEVGAELAVSGQVHLNADLRWTDIDAEDGIMQTAYGPVVTDPVTFGISLGYRFR